MVLANTQVIFALTNTSELISETIQFEQIDEMPNSILGFDSFSINQDETIYSAIFEKNEDVYIVYVNNETTYFYQFYNINQRAVYNMIQDDGSLAVYLLDYQYLINIENENEITFLEINSNEEDDVISRYFNISDLKVTTLDNGVIYELSNGVFFDRLIRIEAETRETVYFKLSEWSINILFALILLIIYLACVIYSKSVKINFSCFLKS